MFDTSEGFESGVGWATPGVPVPRSAPELPAELRALRAAIDAVAKLDVTAMQGAAVLAQTAAVLAQAQRLQLLGLGLLAEVDRRGLHELAGAPTTARWVEAERVGVDRNAVAVARRLEVFPQVAAAVLAGQVSLPVAQRLQTALHRVRPHLDRPDGLIDGQPATEVLHGVVVDGVRTLVTEARGGFVADDPVLPALVGQLEQIVTGTYGSDLQVLEAGLLVLAGHVEAAQLPGCLALLVDALLPLQHEQRVRDGHDVCGLQLVREPDGRGWRLTGRLDLECGERLHVMLNAELLRDGAALHDTAAAAAQLRAGGQDPYDAQRPHAAGTARPRSSDERAHDALNNGLARYLAADLGGSHDKNPVQIVVDRRRRAARRRAGRAARPHRHRHPDAHQPHPPLDLRQRPDPPPARPARPGSGGQSHAAHADGRRAPGPAHADRRALPRGRLHPLHSTRRHDRAPAPREPVEHHRNDQPHRHGAAVRLVPSPRPPQHASAPAQGRPQPRG